MSETEIMYQETNQRILARESQSQTIEEYLQKPNTRVNALKERDNTLKKPMGLECIAAVVIPAHNESTGIVATLDALDRQTFSADSGLKKSSFEVIIVENNSSDNTADIVREWISRHADKSDLRVILLSEQIDQSERGVGAARKIGADLEVYRSKIRDDDDTNEFYILGLDADNPAVPTDHLEKYITTFREKKAKVLAGKFGLDTKVHIGSKLLGEALELAKEWLNEQNSTSGADSTYGFNMGVERNWYVRTGGYPRTKTGEDFWIGEATKELGEKIDVVDSAVDINLRRIILDPNAFFSGEAYKPAIFDINAAAVRLVTSETSETISDDSLDMKKLLAYMTRVSDEHAISKSRQTNIPINILIEEGRTLIDNFLVQKGFNSEITTNNSPYWIEYGKDFIFRQNLSQEEKAKKLSQGIVEVSKLIENTEGTFIYGQSAEYVRFKGVNAPSLPRVAIGQKTAGEFREKMKSARYQLYDLGTWDYENQKYCRRVEDGESLIDNECLVFIRADEVGTPILEEGELPIFSISFYEENPDGIRFNSREKKPINCQIKRVEFNTAQVKIPDDITIIASIENSPEGRVKQEKLFQQLDETQKQKYGDYVIKRLGLYAAWLEETVKERSRTKSEDEIVESLLDDVFYESERKDQEIRKGEAASLIRLMLLRLKNGGELKTESLRLVIDFAAPEYVRPYLKLS